MQNDVSQFVVNIIPLQNIQTNVSGLDNVASLSNTVANIQQMVNYDTKSINTDFLSAFTPAGTIQVTSPINMSNGISIDSIPITGSGAGTSAGSSSSLSNASTSITLYSTGTTSISFVTAGITALTLSNTGAASFTGNVYAQQFITVSDARVKRGITTMDSVLKGITELGTYKYEINGNKDIGVLAQEVEEIFPECVETDREGNKYVKYNGLVAVLIGAVKELSKKVDQLSAR